MVIVPVTGVSIAEVLMNPWSQHDLFRPRDDTLELHITPGRCTCWAPTNTPPQPVQQIHEAQGLDGSTRRGSSSSFMSEIARYRSCTLHRSQLESSL